MESFSQLVKAIRQLRDPDNGCPWDLKQTHRSLVKYMLEEAYEAAECMQAKAIDDTKLKDELGDVLLQVVLNSQLASERKAFDVDEVIKHLTEKMIRRHPHVFDQKQKQLPVSDEALHQRWNEIKEQEKRDKAAPKNHSAFDEAKKVKPATSQAQKIGKIAAKLKFDWTELKDVFQQLRSEIDELEQAVDQNLDSEQVLSEAGDVYFSLAQLCRHLKLDSESAALYGNQKFLNRVELTEKHLKKNGLDWMSSQAEQKEKAWLSAKKEQADLKRGD